MMNLKPATLAVKQHMNMKTLNQNNTQTFCRLIELMQGKEYLKIDNEPFMPLSIEKLAENVKVAKYDNAAIFSLAHYYTLNGDLMSDPEMTFIVVIGENGLSDTEAANIIPCSFSQADMSIYQESVRFSDLNAVEYDDKLQEQHTEFANVWLSNINQQGFTETNESA